MNSDVPFTRHRPIRLFFKGMLLPLLFVLIATMQSRQAAVAADKLNKPYNLDPTGTPTGTRTPTSQPTSTVTLRPIATPPPPTRIPTSEPTAIPTPVPVLQPASDGVKRTANVPILMYHYISAPPNPNDKIRIGLSVSPEHFDAQMKLLADNGYQSITLLDLYQYLAAGRDLPAKPIVLTFDDGYVDNYENAYPILQKYGLIGTFFVLTESSDYADPNYMSWPMIKEMSDNGMDIELHSKDHIDLRYCSYECLIFQIIGGRQSIEGHTGRPVNFMAYPSGKYNDTLLRFLNTNNFWAAVTTINGRIHSLSESLLWTRLRVPGQLTPEGFAKLLGITNK